MAVVVSDYSDHTLVYSRIHAYMHTHACSATAPHTPLPLCLFAEVASCPSAAPLPGTLPPAAGTRGRLPPGGNTRTRSTRRDEEEISHEHDKHDNHGSFNASYIML